MGPLKNYQTFLGNFLKKYFVGQIQVRPIFFDVNLTLEYSFCSSNEFFAPSTIGA